MKFALAFEDGALLSWRDRLHKAAAVGLAAKRRAAFREKNLPARAPSVAPQALYKATPVMQQ